MRIADTSVAPDHAIAPLVCDVYTAPQQYLIDSNQMKSKSVSGWGCGNVSPVDAALDSLGMPRGSARKITVKNCADGANKQTSLG